MENENEKAKRFCTDHKETTSYNNEYFSVAISEEISLETILESETAMKNPQYNKMNISELVKTSIRYPSSVRQTSAIATATLQCAGVVDKHNTTNIIAPSKVAYWREKVMKRSQEDDKEKLKSKKLQCLMFDGRIDQTKCIKQSVLDGVKKYTHSVVREEHYAVCDETGDYLTHFTPDKDPNIPAAKQIALKIFDWLQENNCEHCLFAIGCDSTNVNTGYKGGSIFHLERLIGRKLTWIICMLHTNELPLRHLIQLIDGKTTSDTGFSGPLGKILAKVLTLPINPD